MTKFLDGVREVMVFGAGWLGAMIRRFTFVYRTTGDVENFLIRYWPEMLISVAVAAGAIAAADVARGYPHTEAQRAARRAQWGARMLASFMAGAGSDGLLGDI